MRAIVPAAGKGTRLHKMESQGNLELIAQGFVAALDADLPKVMVEACGRPLLETVLDELSFVAPEDIYIVVGYHKEKVMEYFSALSKGYHFVEQKEQLGTGHAVMVCEPWFREYNGTVLVTFGDMPLFRGSVMKKMCEYHEAQGAACTLLTAINPALPYWARIVRDEDGKFKGIVKAKDCTDEQLTITELFSGVLVFDSKRLFDVLPEVGRNNKQHEYYLTEVPGLMAEHGMKIETFMTDDGDDLRGVNTIEDLRICEEVMRKRANLHK